jgi:hypothetical protein
MLSITAPPPDLEPAIIRIKRQVMVNTKGVLEAVGEAVVLYLRSLTSEIRPPAYVGGPERQAHPGHWADVTGELAARYKWSVITLGFHVQLMISNDSGHAAKLELLEGFFVLSGIEEPGGPIDMAFAAVIPVVAPGMQWKRRI